MSIIYAICHNLVHYFYHSLMFWFVSVHYWSYSNWTLYLLTISVYFAFCTSYIIALSIYCSKVVWIGQQCNTVALCAFSYFISHTWYEYSISNPVSQSMNVQKLFNLYFHINLTRAYNVLTTSTSIEKRFLWCRFILNVLNIQIILTSNV